MVLLKLHPKNADERMGKMLGVRGDQGMQVGSEDEIQEIQERWLKEMLLLPGAGQPLSSKPTKTPAVEDGSRVQPHSISTQQMPQFPQAATPTPSQLPCKEAAAGFKSP